MVSGQAERCVVLNVLRLREIATDYSASCCADSIRSSHTACYLAVLTTNNAATSTNIAVLGHTVPVRKLRLTVAMW